MLKKNYVTTNKVYVWTWGRSATCGGKVDLTRWYYSVCKARMVVISAKFIYFSPSVIGRSQWLFFWSWQKVLYRMIIRFLMNTYYPFVCLFSYTSSCTGRLQLSYLVNIINTGYAGIRNLSPFCYKKKQVLLIIWL